MVDSVAVIGVGEMGTPIVSHLVDSGYDVYAYDVTQSARERAADNGATLADSPGEAAAHTDLSLILVGTYDQVEAVLCDEDGILSNASEEHIVAISSTIAPKACEAFADVAAEEGIDVIDVPTCRGGDAAEQGDLLVLGGGDETPFKAARPVLERFATSENVIHLGPVGAGQVGKSTNNTLLWSCLVADYEVLSLAKAYGLDIEQLREVLYRSSGDNWVLHEWDWIHNKWAHKDMAITMEMANEKDVTMPLSGLVRQLVQNITETDLNTLR